LILLDTDHLSVLANVRASGHMRLQEKLAAATDVSALPVVSVEEQCRGWLSLVQRVRDVRKLVEPYERLARLFEFLSEWDIVPFDEPAAGLFLRLRRQRVRVGTQDLKIAAIAMVHEALLLSANLRDFRQVPGLRVENWLADNGAAR
jgi:tRNA(fMet)-specific endonuclease VapC